MGGLRRGVQTVDAFECAIKTAVPIQAAKLGMAFQSGFDSIAKPVVPVFGTAYPFADSARLTEPTPEVVAPRRKRCETRGRRRQSSRGRDLQSQAGGCTAKIAVAVAAQSPALPEQTIALSQNLNKAGFCSGILVQGNTTNDMALSILAHLDCTRFLGVSSAEDIEARHLPVLLPLLHGHVFQFALHAHGCRIVQRVLELVDEDTQKALTQEIKGHVNEALESPHANHVLQRAVTLLRPAAVRFVLTELSQSIRPAALARHPYGCRVLERLIEHFPPPWLEALVREVLEDAHALCRHAYGNFVMQHLLEHGGPQTRKAIVAVLESDIAEISTHQIACSVLDKALSYADPQDQCRLAQQVLDCHGLVVAMASQRNGFAATQRLLRVAQGPLLEAAHAQLAAGADKLHRSKHGRALIAAMWPNACQPPTLAILPPGRVEHSRASS